MKALTRKYGAHAPARKIQTTVSSIFMGALLVVACVRSELDNAFDSREFPLGLLIAIDLSGSGGGNVPPANVPQANASVLDDDSIRLAWQAVGEDHMAGSATRYEIGYRTVPIPDDAACVAAEKKFDPGVTGPAGTMLNYQIDGLVPHENYSFCVIAYDKPGARNAWIIGNVSARINPAPADVSTASATGIAFDTVRLQWNAVGEDGLTGTATRYEIGYATTAIDDDSDCDAATLLDPGVTSVAAGAPMQYDLTGLFNQTTYYFCIRAYDAEDVGDHWTFGTLSATTPEGTAGWGAWGSFGSCSAICGGGTKTQTRTCATQVNGCAGSTTNTVSCNTQACNTYSDSANFSGSSHSLSCPSGYHVTATNCSAGRVAFEGFDYFCPICACGAISRGGAYHNTGVVSGSGGTCTMSSGINGGVLGGCQFFIDTSGRNVSTWTGPGGSGFYQSTEHSMSISCQETP